VAAAMKTFAAVIVVINEPQYHWVVLQFDPKREVLEVLDSMAPKNNTGQMEKIRKVRSPP
jgi:Ulp1 family protease